MKLIVYLILEKISKHTIKDLPLPSSGPGGQGAPQSGFTLQNESSCTAGVWVRRWGCLLWGFSTAVPSQRSGRARGQTVLPLALSLRLSPHKGDVRKRVGDWAVGI